MNFIASNSVIEGKPINAVLYSENGWIILNESDYSDENNHINSENDFYPFDEEELYRRIPAIRGKLIAKEETNIYIDEKSGRVNINPKHKHLGFFTTHEARATNQVNLESDFTSYYLGKRKYSAKLIFAIVCLILCGVLISWVFYFFLARILFAHYSQMTADRNMFLSGTLNPAIVITEKPLKIAVLTDLSKGFGEYPIIRLKNVELPKLYRKKGTMLPIAGGYFNATPSPYWDYYDPKPIPWATTKSNIISQKNAEIPTSDWLQLKSELKKLPPNSLEGYYPIDQESSSWKDIENIEFVQYDDEKTSIPKSLEEN